MDQSHHFPNQLFAAVFLVIETLIIFLNFNFVMRVSLHACEYFTPE